MRKIVMTLAAALLMAGSANAADMGAAGKWTGEVPGRQGAMQQVTLDLKASGGTLTGTITNGDNPAVDIKDGTISGAKVSFDIVRSVQGNDITIKYSGEAKGDDLTLTREVNLPAGAPAGNGPPPPFTLHRAK